MPRTTTILIATLLLTNTFTGALLWRSQERVQYQSHKAQVFVSAFEFASKENYSLRKAIAPQTSRTKSRVLPQ